MTRRATARTLLEMTVLFGSMVLALAAATRDAYAGEPSAWEARNIPVDAIDQLRISGKRGIRAFAMAPNDGWVIVTEDGRYVADRVPPMFLDQLGEAMQAGHRVLSIAFTLTRVGWVLVTDRAILSNNIPFDLSLYLNGASAR